MDNIIKVNLRSETGIVTSQRVVAGGNAGAVIKVPHQGHFNIEIIDEATGLAPRQMVTRRVGKDLILSFDQAQGEGSLDIVLEGYYENENVHLVGQAENARYYEYIPSSESMSDGPMILADDSDYDALAGIAAGASSVSPFLLWAGGGIATAAAGSALASGGGKGGGKEDGKEDETDKSEPDTPEISVTIAPPTDLNNNGRPEISGTSSSPDSDVLITLPDGSQFITRTDSNGHWAFETSSAQPNGKITVIVTAADGNSGSAEITYTDTTPPAAPIITENSDGQLAGIAEAGATVMVRHPKTRAVLTTVADKDGNWHFTPNPVADGETGVEVVALDLAGNVSDPVDVSRPDIIAPDNITSGILPDSISLIDAVDPSTGLIKDGSVTNDPRPTYSGQATSDIEYVNIYDLGKWVGRAEVGDDGAWSWTPPDSLEEGSSHGYTVSAVDKAGNEGPQMSGTLDESWDFTVDTSAPDNVVSGIVEGSVTLVDDVETVTGVISDGGTTNDLRPTLSGKATPDTDSVRIYDNGSLVGSVEVDSEGRWSWTPQADLEEGSSHGYTVSAVDKAGNEGPQISGTLDESWDFTVDTSAPDNVISGIIAESITLTDEVGPITGTIQDGDVTDDSRPVYSGKATPDIDHVRVYDNDKLVGHAKVDKDKGHSWKWRPDTDLSSGHHGLTVSAVDKAGNEGPRVSGTHDKSWDFTLLTSAPSQPSIENIVDDQMPDTGFLQKGQVTNDATLTVNGSAGPDLKVVIWATDADGERVQVGAGMSDENGRWSITTDNLGADGSYKLTATAVNAAGVSSAETGPFDVVLDTTAPDAAKATLMDDQGDVQGAVASGGVTDDRSPTLTGTGEPGATVSVYLDGDSKPAGSVKVDEKGNWRLELSSLNDGNHSYQVKIADSAGNETWSEPVKFTVDSSSVVVSIDRANDNAGSITGAVNNNGLTDDNTPELQGTARAGATVTIKDAAGSVLGTTKANAQGVWSFPLEEVADGTHSWTAEVINEAGNTARASITLTVDSTAPDAPVITAMDDDVGTIQSCWNEPGAVTDDPAPTFRGTAEAGSQVTIYDGEKVLGTVTATDKGEWSYTPTTNLLDGAHHITVTATDAAGNESARSQGWDFILDTAAPDNTTSGIDVDSITLTDSVGPVIGIINDDGVTDDARPVYAGKATTDIDLVNIYDNGKLAGSATVDKDGSWRWTPESDLSSGRHSFTVAAVDKAGNEGPQVSGTSDNSWDFTLLTSAPSQPSIENIVDDQTPDTGFLQKGQVTNDATLTVNGSAGPDLKVVVWATDADGERVQVGAGMSDENGRWSITTTNLGADGTYKLTATAVNAAGVSSAETGPFDVVLDTTAPDAAKATLMDDQGDVQGAVASGGVTDDRSPTLTGTGEPGATVSVYLDGASKPVGSVKVDAKGNWTLELSSLSDGNHSYQVKITDAAGNETLGERVKFTVDSSSVEVTVDQANDNAGSITGAVNNNGLTDDNTPELQGTARAGETVTIKDAAGSVLGTTKANAQGVWTFQLDKVADGTHSWIAEVTNAAGNTARASITLTVDSTAPDAPVITAMDDDVGTLQTSWNKPGAVTDDPAPTFRGTAEAGSQVTIYDGEKVLGTVTATAEGTWSYTPTTNLLDGAHHITVTATDAAGNESARSQGWDFTLDTAAPDNTTSGIAAGDISLMDDVGPVTGSIKDGSVTDDTRPTYAGKATADIDHVNIYDNGKLAGSATVAEDGTWSWTPESDLSSGRHSFTVAAVDKAGNEGPQVSGTSDKSWDFTLLTSAPSQPSIENIVDDQTPDTGFLQKGQATNDATLTVNGSAGPDLKVVIWATDADGKRVQVGEGMSDANGRWSITTDNLGADGTYKLTATAVNAAGVSSAETGPFDVVLDTTAPDAAKATLMDDQGDVQGAVASGGVTDDRSPTLTGTGEPGAMVNVYLDGASKPVGSVKVDEKGNWTLELSSLSDGNHSYQVKITDAAGNETLGERVKFTVDSSSIEVTVDQANDNAGIITGAVHNNGLTDDTTPELQGTTQPGAKVTIKDASGKVLGTAEANDKGVWSFPLEKVADGTHSWTAEVTNAAGNTARASITLTVDSTAPDAPVITSMDDDMGTLQTSWNKPGAVTDDPAPTFRGTAEAGSQVTIYDGNKVLGTVTATAEGTWSYTPTTNLQDGAHRISVASTDAAGNESIRSAVWDFTLDTAAPDNTTSGIEAGSITLTDDVGPVTGAIKDGSVTDDTRPTYTGKATADIDHVNIYDNGGLVGSAPVAKDGTWSWTPESDLASGRHSFTVAAVDKAGNEGPQMSGTDDNSWDFTLLTSAPSQPSIENIVDDYSHGDEPDTGFLQKGQVTNDATLTVNGSAGPDLKVVVWATDANGKRVQVGEGVADSNGRWSITTDKLAADGAYKLTATAVNAAGISSAETGPFDVVLDTTAPDAAKATLMDDQGDVQGAVVSGSVTDDRSPTLTGTGEPGATVSVYLDGNSKPVGSVKADAKGNWTLELSGLSDGNHSYQVKITDAAGNETRGEPVTFTVDSSTVSVSVDRANDDAGSLTGAVHNNGLTDDTTPELQGTTQPGAVVTIKDASGKVLGTAEASDKGVWTFQLDKVADGTHSWTAEVTNAAGNTAQASITLTVDSTAPAAPAITSMDDDVGSIQTSWIKPGAVTDDAAPTFRGSAEAGSQVTIYDGEKVLGTVTASAEGSWIYTPDASLKDGDHRISVTATDAAGNESIRSAVWDFTLDTTAPDNITSGVLVDSVSLTDDVGSITGTINDGGVTDDVRPTYAGKATGDIDHVNIYDNGGLVGSATVAKDGTWSWTPETDLAGGRHSFTVSAVDKAGNEGPQMSGTGDKSWDFTLLTGTPSQPSIESVVDDSAPNTGALQKGQVTNDTTLTLNGSAGPDLKVVVWATDADGKRVQVGEGMADENGRWSITTTRPGPDGAYKLTATAVNAAGVSSAESGSFEVVLDTTAPDVAKAVLLDDQGDVQGAVAAGGVTDDRSPTLTGTGEPGATVSVYLDGASKPLGSVKVDEKGNWKIELSNLKDGDHSYQVAIADAAGNETRGEPVTFTVDSSSVAVSIAQANDDAGSITGAVHNNGLTDDTTPELQGTSQPGAVVTIKDASGKVLGTAEASDKGVWTFQLDKVADGTHSWTAEVTNAAGNSDRASITLTVDSKAPAAPAITSMDDDVGSIQTSWIKPGAITDDAAPTFQGTAEAGSQVTVYDGDKVLGTVTASAEGTWIYTPGASLKDGAHRISVTATDAAGNESIRSAVWDFTLDTTAPDNSNSGIKADSITLTDDVGPITGTINDGGVTDDVRPTYAGKATADIDHVNIYDNGGLVGSATVAKDGSWSWTPEADLAGGRHSFTVSAVDKAGNEGPQMSGTGDKSWDFTLLTGTPSLPSIESVVDDSAPNTGVLQKGQSTNDTTLTLNGSAGPDLKVVVWATDADGKRVQVGEGMADENGRWSITTTRPGPDGAYKLTATAVNAAGVSSAETGAFEVVLDTTAPDVAKAVLLDDQGDVQGAVAAGGVTDDRSPTLTGTGEPGATVSVYLDGGSKPVGSVKVDAKGNWTLELNNLKDGDHSYQVTIADAAGNEARGEPVKFTVDSSSVAVSVDQANDDVGNLTGAVHNNGLTDDNTPELQGTSQPGTEVTIKDASGKVLGTAEANDKGVWTFQLDKVADGTHSWTAEVINEAGNTARASITLTVDSTAPAAPTITLMDDDVGTLQNSWSTPGAITDDPAPTFRGVAEAGSRVTVYDGDKVLGTVTASAEGTWSYTPTTNLLDGTHRISVTSTDAAGNESIRSAVWDFTLDTTAPDNMTSGVLVDSVSLTDDVGPVTGAINDGGVTDDVRPTYAGKTTGDIDHVNIYDNGGLVGSATVAKDGSWSWTPEADLAGGRHSFTVSAVDKAGNEGPQVSGTGDKSWDFTLLTGAPSQPSIENVLDDQNQDAVALQKGQVTNDATLTLNGSAGPDLKVIVWATDADGKQVQVGEGQSDANGRWSITTTRPGPDGAYKLTATAVNAAGVSSAESGSFDVVLDTTAPDAAKAVLLDDQGDVQGAVAAGGVTDDRSPTLTGTGEPGATVSVYLDGASKPLGSVKVDEKGNWKLELSSLNDGNHSYQVNISDVAGNETRGEPVTFTVDSSKVSVTVDQANDNAGSLTGAVHNNGLTDDTTPELQGTTQPGAVVTIKDASGKVLGTAEANDKGVWSFPLDKVADGTHSWTAEVTNAAGNSARDSITLTVDSKAPDAPVISSMDDDVGTIQTGWSTPGAITDDPAPTFRGTAEVGSLVTIYDGEKVLGTVTATDKGEWSYTPTTNLLDGSHRISVTATDAAGNESIRSAVWDFTLDTTAPDNSTSGIEVDSITLTDDVGPITGAINDGGVTDDVRPTYAGKATADIDHVNIYDNGGLVGSATVAKDGTWSWTPEADLAGGRHSFTVAAVDKAGNEGPQMSGTGDRSWDFTLLTGTPAQPSIESVVDDTAPNTGVLQKGQSTNDTTLTLNGSAGPDLKVVVWATDADGKQVQVGEGQSDANGRWSITTTNLGADGAYKLTVTAVNAAGVSSAESGSFDVVLDTTAPDAAKAVLLDDQGDVQGAVAAGGVTDDRSPTLTGTGEPGATVSVYLDGGSKPVGSVKVDAKGNWTLELNNLKEGEHSYQVTIADAAGNETRGEPVTFTVDSSNVSITVDQANDNAGSLTGAVHNNGLTDDTTPELQGTTQPGAVVTIKDASGKVLGTAEADDKGVWSFPLDKVADGTHSWTAEVTNAAGNSARDSITLTVDSKAPDAPVISSMDDDVGTIQTGWSTPGAITDDPAPTFRGTAEAGSQVTIYDGEKVLGTVTATDNGEWSYTPTTNLLDGTHRISVTATDAAGNESIRSAAWDFTLDTTAPDNSTSGIKADSITLTDDVGPITGAINDGGVTDDVRPTYAGKATADIDHVNIYDNGGLVGSATVAKDGTWSWTPETDLAGGRHSFTVSAVDKAGNEGPQMSGTGDRSWDFTLLTGTPSQPSIESVVDDSAPNTGALQKGQVTNDTTLTLNGSAGPDLKVVVWATDADGKQVQVGEGQSDSNGRWSITTSKPGPDGAYKLTATAVNAAGVSSTESGSFDVVLDTTAPDAAKATLMDDQGDVQGAVAAGGVTDDRSPTLTGTGEPGATVSVYLDGASKPVGSVKVDAKGNWTLELSNLEDGEHRYSTTITDVAGNETSGEPVTFTVDSSKVSVTVDQANDNAGSLTGAVHNNGLTDDTTPELQGTTQPGAVVTIKDASGKVLGTAEANDKGVWSFPLDKVADGTHSWTAEVTNAAGNSARDSITLTVDSRAPDAPVISSMDDDVGTIQAGWSKPGAITDDPAPTFRGTAEAGSQVTIYDGEKVLGTVTATDKGEWSYTPTTNLLDGTHRISVTSTDAAGNESIRSAAWDFTLDTTAPDNSTSGIGADGITLTDDVGPITGAINDGGVTDDARPVYAGKATADIDHVNIYDNGSLVGSATVAKDGTWSWTPENDLADGSHSFTAAAVDQAGNEGPQMSGTGDRSWDFTLLTETPAQPSIESVVDDSAPNTGALQKGQVTNDTTLTLNGSAGPDLKVVVWATDADGKQVQVGEGQSDSNGRWSITTSKPGPDGAYKLTVTAVNAAGVSSAESGAFGVVLDTTAPDAAKATLMDDQGDVQGAVAAGGVTDDRAPTLTGTGEPGATVSVYLDGGSKPVGSVKVDEKGNWKLELSNLKDGNHSYQVTIADAAGNETRGEPVTFTVDSSKVSVTVDQANDNAGSLTGAVHNNGLTDDTTPELQGTTQPGAVVTIKDASGKVLGTAEANDKGVWSFPLDKVADGTHSWTAEVTNAAGNSARDSITLTVDSRAPDAPVITSMDDDVGTIQTGWSKPGAITDDPAPTFRGTAEAGSQVTIYDGEKVLGTVTATDKGEWSYTPTTNLLDGTHRISVTSTDAAGNESIRSAVWDFTLDTTAPDNSTSGIGADGITLTDDVGPITGAINDGGVTDDARPVYAGKATADIDHVNIYDNGSLVGSATVAKDGS